VTLFASADSVTAGELVGCASTALRLDRNVRDPIPYYMLMLDRVRKLAEEFDILHFHIDQFHFPLFAQIADRTVTTLHGRQDLPDLKPLYLGFSDGSNSDFRPFSWPRIMLRSTVRCSRGHPYRTARRPCSRNDRYWQRS
jgi:hypothetical protein